MLLIEVYKENDNKLYSINLTTSQCLYKKIHIILNSHSINWSYKNNFLLICIKSYRTSCSYAITSKYTLIRYAHLVGSYGSGDPKSVLPIWNVPCDILGEICFITQGLCAFHTAY